MKWTDILRTFPGAASIGAGVSVPIKTHQGDTLITTPSTDGNGLFTATVDFNPGPTYWAATDTAPNPDVTRKGSSKSAGMAGPLSLYELAYLIDGLAPAGGHVLDNVLGELAVTYDGAGLDIDIATGGAIVRGILCMNYTADELAVTAAHATLPRIDTVVIEVTRLGQTEEGKAVLKLVNGTPNAAPVAPTLTQSSTTWQHPLADLRVNAAATTVASVTDRRTFLMDPASLVGNPVLQSTVRRTGGSYTAVTSNTGENATSLSTTVTLVNGVIYDVFADAWVNADMAGGTGSLAVYINGTGNLGSWTDTALDGGLSARHFLTVTGTGAAISCGAQVKESVGGAMSYADGYFSVVAVPRF